MGEELGNFHIDFSMDNANTEIDAIESLFLGKTTYTYILEPTDKDGNTINSERIIMKGIPTPLYQILCPNERHNCFRCVSQVIQEY